MDDFPRTALYMRYSLLLFLVQFTFVGAWFCVLVHERHYEDVEGFVEIRLTRALERYVGAKSETSPEQFCVHWSPTINDCLYRNMYRFQHIAVIDYDEVRQNSNVATVVSKNSPSSVSHHFSENKTVRISLILI